MNHPRPITDKDGKTYLHLDRSQLLPVIHETDGGKHGKGHDLQYRCYHCRWFRRCKKLRITQEKNTHCNWSPSRFQARKEVA